MNGIKRMAALMLAIVLAAASFPGTAGASDDVIIGDSLGVELDPNAPWALVSAVVDGRRVLGARLIDSLTYLPLRSVCEDAGYSVSWDAATKTAAVSGEKLQMTVKLGGTYLVANGRYIYLNGTVQLCDGMLYVPSRPLAKALGWSVEWDGSTRTATFTSTGETIKSGDEFYNESEVKWLAKIITAEAGGEPFLGQIAVGAVVLNRMRSPKYPNTIYGVIFDRVGGVQFEPTLNGSIWRDPSANAVIAAKLALEGTNPVGGSLFFLNPSIAKSSWIQRNRTFFVRIGHHDFYL